MSLEGLDPSFMQKVQRLIAASGGKVTLVSGFRSVDRQRQLFSAAVKKYGSEGAARKWVAPPGKSNHNRGIAVDLGGDLALAAKLAPQYGLYRPMKHEPWHFEPAGSRDGSDPEAYTIPPGEAVDQPVGGPDLHDPGYQLATFMSMLTGNPPQGGASESADVLSGVAAAMGAPTGGSGDTSGVSSRGGNSAEEVARAAYQAGFRGEALVIAVATAMAESSGRPDANAAGAEDSRGLWQINVDPSKEWGRKRLAKYGDLYDPVVNARAAFEVSDGGRNWKPWTMFRNGGYQKYLGEARAAAGQVAA